MYKINATTSYHNSIEIFQISQHEFSMPVYDRIFRLRKLFDELQCLDCSELNKCPVENTSLGRSFNFKHEDYLRQKRLKSRLTMPPERKHLRNNVEATIHEFTCRMPNRKLKVRGHFKTSLFAYAVGVSSNFGRIFRYLTDLEGDQVMLREYFKELAGHAFDIFRFIRRVMLPTTHAWSLSRFF